MNSTKSSSEPQSQNQTDDPIISLIRKIKSGLSHKVIVKNPEWSRAAARNDNTNLKDAVDLLGLPISRYYLDKSPSELTLKDSDHVGFIYVKDLQAPDWLKFQTGYGATFNTSLLDHVYTQAEFFRNLSTNDYVPVIHASLKDVLHLDQSNLSQETQLVASDLCNLVAYIRNAFQNASGSRCRVELVDASGLDSTIEASSNPQQIVWRIANDPSNHQEFSEENLLDLNSWVHSLRFKLNSSVELATEMMVQHTVGSALAASFHMQGMLLIADKSLDKTAYELRMAPNHYGDYRPDLASCLPSYDISLKLDGPEEASQTTVVSEANISKRGTRMSSDDGPMRVLSPLLLLGEAKRRKVTSDSDGLDMSETDNSTFRVQMQAYIYPTLVLMALLFEKAKQDDPTAITRIPKQFMVYGFYYDQHELQVYGHFPVHRVLPDRRTQWRFVQIHLATIPFAGAAKPPAGHPQQTPSGDAAWQEECFRRIQLAIVVQVLRAAAAESLKFFDDRGEPCYIAAREKIAGLTARTRAQQKEQKSLVKPYDQATSQLWDDYQCIVDTLRTLYSKLQVTKGDFSALGVRFGGGNVPTWNPKLTRTRKMDLERQIKSKDPALSLSDSNPGIDLDEIQRTCNAIRDGWRKQLGYIATCEETIRVAQAQESVDGAMYNGSIEQAWVVLETYFEPLKRLLVEIQRFSDVDTGQTLADRQSKEAATGNRPSIPEAEKNKYLRRLVYTTEAATGKSRSRPVFRAWEHIKAEKLEIEKELEEKLKRLRSGSRG